MEYGQEGEKVVSRTHGDSMGTNTILWALTFDDNMRVKVQPIVGTVPVGTPTDDDVQVHVQSTMGQFHWLLSRFLFEIGDRRICRTHDDSRRWMQAHLTQWNFL